MVYSYLYNCTGSVLIVKRKLLSSAQQSSSSLQNKAPHLCTTQPLFFANNLLTHRGPISAYPIYCTSIGFIRRIKISYQFHLNPPTIDASSAIKTQEEFNPVFTMTTDHHATTTEQLQMILPAQELNSELASLTWTPCIPNGRYGRSDQAHTTTARQQLKSIEF